MIDLHNLGKNNNYKYKQELYLENSIIDFLNFNGIEFSERVTIKNCVIKKSSIAYTYFKSGLIIENSVFLDYIDWQAGGHNKKGAIVITGSIFTGFVNFFDCWFQSEVKISNSIFLGGTNLMGNIGFGGEVSFDVPPVIQNVTGDLNRDGEY